MFNRIAITLIAIVAVPGCIDRSSEQQRADTECKNPNMKELEPHTDGSLPRQLLGTWRSQECGGGGTPTYREFTFTEDGIVITQWILGDPEAGDRSQPKKEEYLIDGNDLYMGPRRTDGEFIGQPLEISISDDRLWYRYKTDGTDTFYWTRVVLSPSPKD